MRDANALEQPLNDDGDTVSVVGGGDLIGDSLGHVSSVAHRDAVAGPHQHLVIVEPVAEGNNVLAFDSQEMTQTSDAAALVNTGSR